jgi:hypothetical protein
MENQKGYGNKKGWFCVSLENPIMTVRPVCPIANTKPVNPLRHSPTG